MQYTGVLFDKDGTLFHFEHTWSLWAKRLFDDLANGDLIRAIEMAKSVGFDYHTKEFHPESILIACTPDMIAEALAPSVPNQTADQLLVIINAIAEEVPVVEAAPLDPLLTGLRERGMKLGIATNDAEAPARANLKKAGVTEHFDFIAGFDSGFGSKPEPGMLLEFSNSMGLRAKDVVMVGDSAHDLVAGRAAGMATVAVLTGIAKEPELAPHADVVLADIGHLPVWLDR